MLGDAEVGGVDNPATDCIVLGQSGFELSEPSVCGQSGDVLKEHGAWPERFGEAGDAAHEAVALVVDITATKCREPLTRRTSGEKVQSTLTSEAPSQCRRSYASNVARVQLRVGVVESVRSRRGWIVLDRSEHPEAGLAQPLRGPACTGEQVDDRAWIVEPVSDACPPDTIGQPRGPRPAALTPATNGPYVRSP
jgi:hypothetical protein